MCRSSKSRVWLGLAAALGLFAAACGSSSHSPTAPSLNGHLTVKLTDASTDEVGAINVYVSGLTVKPKDGPVQQLPGVPGLIDLLQLQGTSQDLVDVGVPAGDYEFVQVELDQSKSNVVEMASGETKPLKIASQEIKVLGGFTIPVDGTATVLLDFKAGPSLQHLGNGDWLLTPVIEQVAP